MNYLKVYTDFETSIEMLSDAEVGRLFRAMLRYADRGEVSDLCGNERFLWGAAKVGIDHEQEYRRQRAENGAAGGRPAKANKSNEKQKKAKESNEKQTKANKSRNEYEYEYEMNSEYESEDELDSVGAEQAPPPSFLLADGTEYILTENQITTLINGFPMLDVWQTLADIKRWCAVNHDKRKTRAEAERFVNAWFVRERDKKDKWKAEAEAKKQPEKKRSGKYDEIYEKY